MRCIKRLIPEPALLLVAKQMRDAYPNTFEERLKNGKRAGNGVNRIIRKMRDHNNYLNRIRESSKSVTVTLKIPSAKRKGLVSISAGCPNWQPEYYATDENANTCEEHRQELLLFKDINLDDDATLI